jgi:hypothetical protein
MCCNFFTVAGKKLFPGNERSLFPIGSVWALSVTPEQSFGKRSFEARHHVCPMLRGSSGALVLTWPLHGQHWVCGDKFTAGIAGHCGRHENLRCSSNLCIVLPVGALCCAACSASGQRRSFELGACMLGKQPVRKKLLSGKTSDTCICCQPASLRRATCLSCMQICRSRQTFAYFYT